jgi:NAD(P)-dependent dehydrogenase (short-subunit alcohol dehydrogenase family)
MNVPTGTGMAGQHAVVTGGARGIGAAIASALASHGVHVTVMGRTVSSLTEMAQSLRGRFKTRAHWVVCDVANPGDVSRAFGEAVDTLGAVGILINNAGQAMPGAFDRISLDTWNRMIAVNLTGALLCTQQVLPAMIAARSGRIVNVASTAGLKGYSGLVAYCATKHGLIGLTRALAAETGRSGITVNAVCPGYTEGTNMLETAVANVMSTRKVPADEARALLAKASLRRTLITPEEVADTVVWLCSPAAGAITGQAIAVASGEVM